MNISYSGYGGDGTTDGKGNEYIKIPSEVLRNMQMKVKYYGSNSALPATATVLSFVFLCIVYEA